MRGGLVRSIAAVWLLGTSSLALAGEALKFAPPPAWVSPTKVPTSAKTAPDAPIAVLLNDQQIYFEPGRRVTFSEVAIKLQTAQGLAAGNVVIPWNPATEEVTVHKLHILRGDKVIDVLAGQKFTTIRRESNLEAAVLDGRLTATLQPEGLQEGDIINFAVTMEHADPVMKGHVETAFAMWNVTPIARGQARLIWPRGINLKTRQSDGLPRVRTAIEDGRNVIYMSLDDIQPLIAPAGAPPRFQLGRIAEASDYGSWSDVAALMIPLFDKAAVIPTSGPLRDELERIRKESADPATRAEKALALVQDRIRYVALLMGEGGYVPASAESTWSQRLGDCKAKTALLVALLRELGIEAEPVMVHAGLGDAIPTRLPMLSLFNHVLVRARINGKTYWLDGTRSGDVSLDRVPVPAVRWGLPLVAKADLVPIVAQPLTVAEDEQIIEVDATAGLYAPATVSIDQVFRGDGATMLNSYYAQISTAQRDELLRENAKRQFDGVTVKSSSVKFDKARGELRMEIKGEAKLEWDDGWFWVPGTSIAFDPDFDRPAGPLQEAPFAVAHPDYGKRRVTVRLPVGVAAKQKLSTTAIKETLAGVEYERKVEIAGDVLRVESSHRSVAAEVPYKEALAAAPRLKALYNDDIHLNMPVSYQPTDKDVSAKMGEQPASLKDHITRGWMLMERRRWDEAIVEFDKLLASDPKNVWALSGRAVSYAWKRDSASAERDIKAVQAIEPDNAAALRAAGMLAEFRGDHEKAAEYYSKSLESEPGNIFALFRRAGAALAKGKFQDAIRDHNAALAVNPRDDTVLAARAIAYAGLKDVDAADKDVAAALAINPNNPMVHNARALVALSKGDFKAAVEAFDKELQLAPSSPSVSGRAQAHFALGEMAKALADSEQALKLQPGWPEMRLLRANAYRRQGNRDAAIKEAQLLMAENPKSDFALVTAARIFEAHGKRAEAMAAFDAAIAVKPAAYVYLNRSQSRPRDDVAGRLADLDQALKLEPDQIDAIVAKADLLADQGKFVEAVELYDRTKGKGLTESTYTATKRAAILFKAGRQSDAEKGFAEVRSKAKTAMEFNNLCWAKATEGILLESALDDCREALKLQPDDGPYLDSLGMVLLRLGKLDEALAAYDKAVAKNTGSASLMGRAMVHMRKGDKARAEADRAEALKVDPEAETRFADYGLKLNEAVATPE